MSQINRRFTPGFKSKVVLELLETGSDIASKYNILPKSVTTWKEQFVGNASSALEESVSTMKYKDENPIKNTTIRNFRILRLEFLEFIKLNQHLFMPI